MKKQNVLIGILFGLMIAVISLLACSLVKLNSLNNLLTKEDVEDIINSNNTPCTITYNFNLGRLYGNYYIGERAYSSEQLSYLILSMFNQVGYTKTLSTVQNNELLLQYEQKANKDSYFKLYDFTSVGLSDYFLGWYVGDHKVEPFDTVKDNITLQARWTDSITNLICAEKATFHYSTNYKVATAFPVANHSYSTEYGTEARIFKLNDLTIHNNQFYKITSYRPWAQNDVSYTYLIEQVVLPDSFSDFSEIRTITYMNGQCINDIMLKTKHYNNGYYTIGNFAIGWKLVKSGNYEKGYIQYIYEVDYDTCEARLCRITTSRKNRISEDVLLNIEDFQIEKDGKKYNIKVTSMAQCAKIPFFFKDINYTNKINLKVVVSDSVEKLVGNSYSLEETEKLNPREDIIFTIYSLKTTPSNGYETEIFGMFSDKENNKGSDGVETYIYYYSETEPTDTNNSYWHYDENQKIVLW